MPFSSLLNLLSGTKLKSLKYGNDRPGGGDSGQPYITTDINDTAVNDAAFKFDDGLIRGGATATALSALRDTERIGKFFLDAPRGPLFIAKQVGLQLSNPRLETSPVASLGGGGTIGGLISTAANFLSSNIGPTRIYNLGVNTLAQIPVNAIGGHIERHGLTPFGDPDSLYARVAVANNVNNNNRLVKLKGNLISTDTNPDTLTNILTNISNTVAALTAGQLPPAQNAVIDSYIAGPGSVYGIGSTLIRRFDYTNNDYTTSGSLANTNDKAKIALSNINYANDLGVSEQFFGSNSGSENNINGTSAPTQLVQFAIPYSNPANKRYADLMNIMAVQTGSSSLMNVNLNRENTSNFIYSGNDLSSSYNGNTISYTNSYLEKVVIKGTWRNFNRETRVGSGRKDALNLTPLISSDNYNGQSIRATINGKSYNVRDLIKFRMEAINTDNPSKSVYMFFRAYLKTFSDSHSPEWSDTKYVGRGDKFHIYNGYSRQITFSFKVAALSRDEMMPMYQRLNYLASNTAPDYTTGSLMRGPFMNLTVGNYIYRQPGYISSLQYSIADDTPWEIAIDEPEQGASNALYELPHIIDVNMSFVPVHNFLPQKSALAPFIIDKAAENNQPRNPWLLNNLYNANKNNGTIIGSEDQLLYTQLLSGSNA